MIVLFSVHISLPRQWLHTWAENIYSIMCLSTENTVWESVCPSLLWSVGKYIRQKVRSKVQQCVLWLRCIIVKGTEHTHKHWVLMSALRFSLQCSTRWDPAESGPNACLTKKHLIHQHKHQTKRNQRPINTLSSTLACSLTCIKNLHPNIYTNQYNNVGGCGTGLLSSRERELAGKWRLKNAVLFKDK